MGRTHRSTTQRKLREAKEAEVASIDFRQVATDPFDDEAERQSQTASTYAFCRRDRRLRHLLTLPKGERKQILDSIERSSDERYQLYLLRKMEEKARKLARKNTQISIQHFKGERRKTHWVGVGKAGSRFWFGLDEEDIDAAREHSQVATCDGLRGSSAARDSDAILDQLTQRFETSAWDDAVKRASGTHGMGRVAPAPTVGPVLPAPIRKFRQLVKPLEETGRAFDAFRASFLRRHGRALRRALTQLARDGSLAPAPLADDVQGRFLAACGNDQDCMRVVPGFHGTRESVHESIFARGLLIPGQSNEIRVAHGSAHGNGVYIAKLNNPRLSVGFTDSPGSIMNEMLVCGVVDDSSKLNQSERLGSFTMTQESKNVRHVGDAMVVFNRAYVAPLFVVKWPKYQLPSERPSYPQRSTRKFPRGYIRRWRRGPMARWNESHRRAPWRQVSSPESPRFLTLQYLQYHNTWEGRWYKKEFLRKMPS